ncbi:MAG: hypothetical protein NZ920_06250 [Aigarchaeota archaeon]|nr:hypothetical protein [Aigarchaeota archaeon]MDW8092708.1 proton-conducting transporter membrane subunit [Nitrososphaerota archaeon]
MPVDLGPILNFLLPASVVSIAVSLISRALRRQIISGLYASAVLASGTFLAYGMLIESSTIQITPSQLPASVLLIDQISVYLSTISLGVIAVAAVYSLRYVHERMPEYFILLLFLGVGMVGVFSSGDFVTFFVFWEVMSISSYLLVAFNYKRWESVEASLKYLIMSSTGSAAILFGISLIYGMVGDLNFETLSKVMNGPPVSNEMWSTVAMVLIIGGLGVNSAMAPFHSWLPDAHPAAPSPVSAILSGVVIKTGIFFMFRLFSTMFPETAYGWSFIILSLALLTMTIGNLLALMQDDIKRLLAFSSVANIGYIVFAIGLHTELAFTGGLLHVLNHAVSKALLFLAAGCFIHTLGVRELSKLSGVARKMPVSGVCYAIGAFSLAGMPGLNVFVSEYTILYAAFQIGYYVPAAIMIFNILIGAMYHLRVIQIVFSKKEAEGIDGAKEVSPIMLVPLLALAGLSIAIGVYASPFLSASRLVATSLLG